MSVATGTIAFESLRQTDVFNGQDTGKYSVTVTLDEDCVKQLKSEGVKLKEYDGNLQRKFASKFKVPVFDENGADFMGQITRGSKVKVKYTLGKPHPVHGVTPYMSAVKITEVAEGSGYDADF